MVGTLLRHLALLLVRLFYAPLEVANDRLTRAAPGTILIPNHPNGALDAVVVYAALRRPLTMLSKSTPFASPVARWILHQIGALPLYRKKDIGKRGGATDPGDMRQRNEQTFRDCRELLMRGKAIVLFPEGLTHAEPRMAPLHTGAARLALSAAASMNWERPEIIPVGLWYQNATRFRSPVLVVPGVPINLSAYQDSYKEDARETARMLTAQIENGLRDVVLEAETSELLKSAPLVATWTAPEGIKPDLAAMQTWTGTLLEGYRTMHAADPERLATIEESARQYARTLQVMGIRDPWKLESPKPVAGYAVRRALLLLAWSPFALVGTVISYVPYRLSAYVVRAWFPDNRPQAGTFKLATGTILVVVAWVMEAITLGMLAGALWGVLLLVTAPVCGYFALRWAEVARKLRAVLRAGWMRSRRQSLVQYLSEQREQLTNDIQEALTHLQSSP